MSVAPDAAPPGAAPAAAASTAEAGGRPHHEGGEHGAHPSDLTYVKVAVFLAVVTGIEVWLSYWSHDGISAPLLLVGMAVKFFAVAAFFMHLRFDSKAFRRLFLIGLTTAVIVYVAALLTFHAFSTHEDRGTAQGAASAALVLRA